jgi:PAS domain S-box-containing protein
VGIKPVWGNIQLQTYTLVANYNARILETNQGNMRKQNSELSQAIIPGKSSETWNILLVDDDEDDYYLTRTRLSCTRGRKILLEWANSYNAGREKMLNNQYQAVLIDYDLGDSSGIELIREMASLGYPAPLILYTGRGSLEVDIEAMQAGATLYLTKEEANPLLLERFIRYGMERKQAEAALSADLEAMKLLHEVSTHDIENGDIMSLLESVLDAAIKISQADKGNLQLLDPQKRTLSVVAQSGFEPAILSYFSEVDESGPSSCARTLKSGQRVVIEDVEKDPLLGREPFLNILREAELRAVQSTTLLTREGLMVGVLSTHWSRPHHPDRQTLQRIDLLARQAADSIERRKAEEVLRLTKERYQTLLDSINEGYCVVEMLFDDEEKPCDYRFLEINRTFEMQTGLVDPLGKLARELVPGLESHWFELYGKVAKTGEPARFEIPARDMGGRWFNGNAFRVGKPEEYRVGIHFMDITQRKRTEQALRENAERDAYRLALGDTLRTINDPDEIQTIALHLLGEHLQANLALYLDILPDGEQAHVKQSYAQGMPEISGLVVLDELGPGRAAQLRAGRKIVVTDVANLMELTETEKSAYEDLKIAAFIAVPLIKEGRLVTALVVTSFEPRQWRDEEVALVEETAERTWSAIERSRSEAALRESEEHFRIMADGTPIIIWATDADGKIEFVNQAYCEFFGVTAEEVRSSGWQPLVHTDDYAGYVDVFLECLRSGQAFQAETRTLHHSGKWRCIVSYAQPQFSASGKLLRMVGSSIDITDRKQAEADLANYTEQLQQSNQALEDFAFMASHDLRAPIRKVQAFTGQLTQRAADRMGPQERDYLKRIENASNQMQNMLDGLLAYSRISGRGKPPQDCDLNQVAAQVLSDLEFRIKENRATVEAGELPVIQADSLQMYQLLQNLIANAIKFHPPDRSPVVKLSSRPSEDGCVELIVKDNGIGFDMTQAYKLFKPFHRLVGKSDYEGTGMGLAICAKIVERHGGSIQAVSEIGQGSTFTVRLPATTGDF